MLVASLLVMTAQEISCPYIPDSQTEQVPQQEAGAQENTLYNSSHLIQIGTVH